MTTLLVVTVGQSDVQLVIDGARRELRRERCASLHDEIERRIGEWRLIDSPDSKSNSAVEMLPAGELLICTPKLDAVLRYLDEQGGSLRAALVLETRRDGQAERGDPRFAGALIEARLRGKGIETIQRRSYLEGVERLEDRGDPRDAVVRRDVVRRLDQAVRECIQTVEPSRIVVATTGGMPSFSSLVDEIVRLHGLGVAAVDLIEVADGARTRPPSADRAVTRRSEPAASYQARWHALALAQKGNLLGAWGAVQHLHDDEVERKWTQIVEWLACFASSLPMPESCDIPILTHNRMAVRAAIRVELALRTGDIPRAVHGTVAFFESALWDHLGPHLTRHDAPRKHRLFKVDPTPVANLVRRGDGSSDDRGRPFEVADESDGVRWYKVFDDDVCGIRLAKYYLKQECLQKLGQAVSTVRELRNDVAHNEPTPALMDDARSRMADASLWSTEGTFLTQPLVQSVLRELGEERAGCLCTDLMSTLTNRVLCPPGHFGGAS